MFSFLCRVFDSLPGEGVVDPFAVFGGSSVLFAFGGGGTSCFCCSRSCAGDRFEPVFAYRLSLPLMALGVAIVSLFFYDHWALSVLLIGIGYRLFDIVTWILFVDLAKRRVDLCGRYQIVRVGVAATLLRHGLRAISRGKRDSRRVYWSGVQMSTVGILCVTVLVVTAFLVIPEGTIRSKWLAGEGRLQLAGATRGLRGSARSPHRRSRLLLHLEGVAGR